MTETLIWRPPLALRAIDARTRAPILGGLVARAWDPRTPDRAFPAITGPSGVLSWHRIPGVEAWSDRRVATMTAFPLRVEIRDPSRRFQAARFAVDVPRADLLTWPLSGGEPGLPLFAHPAAPTPEGHAAIRAALWDATANTPAAWALLTVQVDAPGGPISASALADANGAVSVFVPWPEPRLTSPATPLANQTWSVTASVRYQRLGAAFPETPPPPGDRAPPALDAIGSQRVAALWTDAARTTPFPAATLRFGQELTLKSTAAATGQSVLLVTPSP